MARKSVGSSSCCHGQREAASISRVGDVGLLALRAQPAGEPLGEDAVERGADEEGLDPHLDETGDGARGVVGVQGREHEVTGEGGLDGDLGGLVVADLTEQHDVGVRPQDRPQRPGERQPGLGIGLHLVDAGQAVLDRVLDRDHVDLGLVDQVQRGVERGRLTRSGRAGDQEHAVRLDVGLAPLLEVRLLEAEVGQLQHGGRVVQDSHDDLLAPHDGQARHAKVDLACRRPGTESRPSWGTRRSAMSISAMILSRLMTPDWIDLRRAHDLVQHAVDAEPDPQIAFARLDVDVGGPVRDRLGDEQVDELDDRGVVDDLLDAGERVVFLVVVERVSQLVERLIAAVVAVDRRHQVGLGGDDGLDVAAGQRADVVDREDVRRVGHRDDQPAVLVADRERDVAAGDAGAMLATALPSTGNSAEVDERKPDLLGECGDELGLGDHPEVDQHPAEAAPEPLLLLDRRRQLRLDRRDRRRGGCRRAASPC